MRESKYSHTIRFDDETKTVEICRILPNGSNVLLTQTPFENARSKGFESFASEIGEVLLLDSPIARRIFDL